jgi:hypothetical protein
MTKTKKQFQRDTAVAQDRPASLRFVYIVDTISDWQNQKKAPTCLASSRDILFR